MKKLPCYGVTARALQNLEASVFMRETIPTIWFNWVGVTSPISPSFYAPRRVELVQANPKASNSMARWSTNATASGYHCILIDSVDDDHCIDDVDDLPDNLDYAIVTSSAADAERNFTFLKQLREPERVLVTHWDDLREGGGVSIEKIGFDEVSFTQWLAYGEAMKIWIEQTRDEIAPDTRVDTPDFSKWNPWEGRGGENRILSLEKHFNTLPSEAWPWNVGNPLTAKQIPSLVSDIEAFWPMRQMPFCGVVRTTKGVLKAVGALPDTIDATGNWHWDDGSIRAAMLKTVVQNVQAPSGKKANRMLEWIVEFVRTSKPQMNLNAAAATRKNTVPKIEVPELETFVEWRQFKDGGEQAESVVCKLYVHQEQVLLHISSPNILYQKTLDLSFVVLKLDGVEQSYIVTPADTPNVWRVVQLPTTPVRALASKLSRNRSEPLAQNKLLIESGLKVC